MTPKTIHAIIQRIQPTTNRSLKRLVEKLAKSPVRIIPVYYFGHYQGCRVKVEGQTLPNKRDVYACSYVEITNPQRGTAIRFRIQGAVCC